MKLGETLCHSVVNKENPLYFYSNLKLIIFVPRITIRS